MTTENKELELRIQEEGIAKVEAEGRPADAFSDPTGQYPRHGYHGEQGVNKAARGDAVNELDLRNGIPGINTDLAQRVSTQYPLASTTESVSGHIIEINDTPGGERIIIRHNTGAGVDIKSDGTVIVNSKSNKVEIVDADSRMVVEGSGNISYYGNLNLNVSGDYNVTVGGNYNLKVAGNWIVNVIGSFKTTVAGLMSEVVQKSKSVIILGQLTQTYLSNVNHFVKGTYQHFIKGNADYNHGAVTKFTSQLEVDVSSPNINIAGDNINILSNGGTQGGENVIKYGKNMYLGENLESKTVTTTAARAVTFIGDLNGTARGSLQASTAGGLGAVSVQAPVFNTTAADTTKTEKPTSAILTEYLNHTDLGVKRVSIDEDNSIKNYYDKTITSGGVTDRALDIREVRSRLKSSSVRSNKTFINDRMAAGVLNSNFVNTVPIEIGRVRGEGSTVRIGQNIIGQKGRTLMDNKFKPADAAAEAKTFTFPLEAQYNPDNQEVITHSTLLGKGIPISKFTGSVGNKTTLNHITTQDEKKQIARNLYVQSQVIKNFYALDIFKNYNLVVAEGLYQAGPDETPTGFNDLAQTGRAVAYEVYSADGVIALDKLYDYAEFLKDTFSYDKIGLAYDTYNKNGRVHGQLIVEIPTIPSSFTATFSMKLETTFNGEIQSSSDLVEIVYK